MTTFEPMITVAIMSVVLLMFTSAMIQIYRSVNKNEALAAARDGINQTFSKLDKEIRYAAGHQHAGRHGHGPVRGIPDHEYRLPDMRSAAPPRAVRAVAAAQLAAERHAGAVDGAGLGHGRDQPVHPVLRRDRGLRVPATADRPDRKAEFGRDGDEAAVGHYVHGAELTSPTTSSNSVCTEGRLVP